MLTLAARLVRATLRRAGRARLESRQLLSMSILAGVAMLIPWTSFLAVTLPSHFRAHNWSVTWVGFDAALMLVLIATAWAAWFRRQVLAALSVVAATMLLCDAWFDVNTAWGTHGVKVSIATALAGNIPLSLALLWLTRRILLGTAAVVAVATHRTEVPHRAIDVAIPVLGTRRGAHARPARELQSRSSVTPSSASNALTRASTSSTMRRTVSRSCPAGSSTSQSR